MVIELLKQCSESKTIYKLDGVKTTEKKPSERLIDVQVEDKAVLVVIDPRDHIEAEANTEELLLLAESAGVLIVEEMHVHRDNPNPTHYLGKGQAEDLFILVQSCEANVVIFGDDLSPTQQRNIEDATKARVVDRTQLILDIFAQRARTSEGKIQVELAQLEYLLPRLSGKGISMSRVGGASAGGVATRGPGETKLETDRRHVRKRISQLKDELEEVVKHRSVQNKARQKLLVPGAAYEGTTDSERFFRFLVHRLERRSVKDYPELVRLAVDEVKARCSYTSLTFLLSNGNYLIGYRDCAKLFPLRLTYTATQ
jgi:GTP-binding protein HflX